MEQMKTQTWITRGFEAFRGGYFGNGGQNLYVSKQGVLQRIYQYDLDRDGYFDLVLCDSQSHCEVAPTALYYDLTGSCRKTLVPGSGAIDGIAADLTGDGYDDLIIAMKYDGAASVLNSAVYYGSEAGYSESRMLLLPTPWCDGVAAGDFSGCGKNSLIFIVRGKLRAFYYGDLGVEARRYQDYDIPARQIVAADWNGNGFCDLAVRNADGETRIYWGGPDGIDPERFSLLPFTCPRAEDREAELRLQSPFERVEEPEPLLQAISFRGRVLLSVITPDDVRFWEADHRGLWTEFARIEAPLVQSVAVGDLLGNGGVDMVLAAREPYAEKECSWVLHELSETMVPARRSRIPSWRACDAVMADFDGDGKMEVILCQSHTPEHFSSETLVLDSSLREIRRLAGDDSRRSVVLRGKGAAPVLALINHFSGSLVGHDTIAVFAGGPDGYLPERVTELPGWCAVEALYVDINDDGIADLVVTNCAENSLWLDPGSYIHINTPAGFDPARMVTLPTKAAHGCVCADLNRNGYLDLLFVSFTEPCITIFYGGPDGFDTEHPVKIPLVHKGKTYNQPRWIYLVDLNRNGWLDLVIPQITMDRSFILWGGPEGFSFDRCQELAVFRACSVRAADFTGNGYPDLVIGGHMRPMSNTDALEEPHDSFAYVYWNGPEGISESNRTMLRADGVNSMAIADFNGDGRLDLFVGSYHNGVERDIDSFIYWNRDGIGFRNSDCTRLPTHSVSGCLAADFNGDGFVDLAVANHKVNGDHVGYSEIWWNGPDGFDPRHTTKLPSKGPHGITAVEPGNQLTRGAEEYYTSAPYQVAGAAESVTVGWEGEIPPTTGVRARLRRAASPELLEQAPWSEWLQAGDSVALSCPVDCWLQYQLELSAERSLRTPRLTEVKVELR